MGVAAKTRAACLAALFLSLGAASAGGCGHNKPGPGDSDGREEAARWLSSRGLYSDIASRTVVNEAIPYTPDYPLWSDGAEKQRWLILPPGTQVDTSDIDHWVFPVGTKAFKEFRLGEVMLETRLVERIADTGEFDLDYRLQTFVWTADQSDALLTTDGVEATNGTEHEVPKQKLCATCHKGEPGAFLGISAIQLSASAALDGLAAAGLLSVPPGRSFPLPDDGVAANAMGVLHANCGHCHSATGPQPKLRLRVLAAEVDRPLETWELYQSTVGARVTDEWLDAPPEFDVRVRPHDPERSAIVYRMAQRPGHGRAIDQMPPIATRKVDEAGLAAVRTWVDSLLPIDSGGQRDGDGPAAPAAP